MRIERECTYLSQVSCLVDIGYIQFSAFLGPNVFNDICLRVLLFALMNKQCLCICFPFALVERSKLIAFA